jgi:uncharacterized membrane protein
MNYTKFFLTRYWYALFLTTACSTLAITYQLNEESFSFVINGILISVYVVLFYKSYEHYKYCKSNEYI